MGEAVNFGLFVLGVGVGTCAALVVTLPLCIGVYVLGWQRWQPGQDAPLVISPVQIKHIRVVPPQTGEGGGPGPSAEDVEDWLRRR